MKSSVEMFRSLLRSSAFRGATLLLAALGAFGIASVRSAAPLPPLVNIAADPLYSRGIRAKPTLTLALSVEFPTVGAQYVASPGANEDATYSAATEYVGYFDAESCYTYVTTGAALQRRFDRSGAATGRKCGGTAFSGNFMNWATSSAIDVLRLGLTGGDRIVDDATTTILQRAVLPNASVSGNFWNGTNFPAKKLLAAVASESVPTALLGSHTGDVYVANCLNRVHFGTAKGGDCNNPGTNSNLGVSSGGSSAGPVTAYTGALPSGYAYCAAENGNCVFGGVYRVYYGAGNNWKVMSANNGTACTNGVFGDPIVGTAKACYYGADPSNWSPGGTGGLSSDPYFYARVKVCDADGSGNLTDPRTGYCVRYPNGNFKPIGNLQRHSENVRVAAFGYLNDNTLGRYGGVLRAPMKYVGPKAFDQNFAQISGGNTKQEWNPSTGVFLRNPDAEAGVTTGSDSNWPGETMSGVTNYLNQFGRTGVFGQYKTYDPVGELYYEALRYVQGLPPTADAVSGVTAGSNSTLVDGFPIQTTWVDPHPPVTGMTDYKCVSNNIVAIGDDNTHVDKSVPGNDRTSNDFARTASISDNLPNFKTWTQVVGSFEADNGMSYLDGAGVARTANNIAANAANPARLNMHTQTVSDDASYYIAGMAYWANTHDIRGTNWSDTSKRRPGMRLTTYILDVNEYASQSDDTTRHNNQFFLASKYGGFKDVSGTGNPFMTLGTGGAVVPDPTNSNWAKLPLPNPLTGSPPSAEAKNYYLSSSARGVLKALDDIFDNITQGANSIAGAAITTQSLTTGDGGGSIYQARFDPANYWSGNVIPYTLTAVGEDNVLISSVDDAAWTAAGKLDALANTDSRKIFLGKNQVNPSTTAMEFTWAAVDTATQNQLRVPPGAASAPYDAASAGEGRLNYLRGVRTGEGTTYRLRGSRLGDIVNSGIAYSGAPPTTISDSAYASFMTTYANRVKALFVGANDGMLHSFNTTNGAELFAYIPSWLTPRLTQLTSSAYVHQSYVDATPVVSEAKVGSTWKTVLVGGTGGGGQGVFALDVTDPAAFTAASVMWEFTDKHDPAMGNVVGKPQILKFRTTAAGVAPAVYKYFAVIASGVNNYAADGNASATGYPALFLLDLSKAPGSAWALGTNYFRIDLPRAASTTAQGVMNFTALGGLAEEVTYIYAGDLQGNLWKFDFTKEGTANWTTNKLSFYLSGGAAVPMFIATDGTNTQPITMAPSVAFGRNRTYVVAFGTGKFIETPDIATPFRTQSLYALYDNNDSTTALDSSAAAIGGRGRLQANTSTASGVTSSGTFVWGRPTGDTDPAYRAGWYFDFFQSTAGERAISSFRLLSGKLVAGSILPAGNSCTDGSGNIYTLDLFNGTGAYVASTVGIPGELLPLKMGNSQAVAGAMTDTDTSGAGHLTTKYRYLQQGSSGVGASATAESVTVQLGRLSWRQLNNNR